MLKRGRQIGQAQALYSEGAAFLEQLKKVEAVQQANRPRIIPTAYDDNITTDWSYFQ